MLIKLSAIVKVFSGRDNGEEARKKFNLDYADDNVKDVIVIVAHDTYSFNTSFFLGMFGPSVKKLGIFGFKEKYQFVCEDLIQKSINNDIERAFKDNINKEWF